MTRENKGGRKIIWWNTIKLLIILVLSFVLLNSGFRDSRFFYATVSALFLFSGIFLKRAYIFLGILILTLAFIFIAKDVIIPNTSEDGNSTFDFNFFINSDK
ncbi:hypothetical protein J5690_08980 [bacterium]|nr:hypothetical protein [bacterium]